MGENTIILQNKPRLLGIVGFIGSGKGTVGDYLVSAYGYRSMSFAHTLKDTVAAIFGWPRDLLEGNTQQGRAWRDVPDPYWSSKMNRDVTPRWVLQHIGTDVMRDHFIDNIWVWSLEKNLINNDQPTVITDVRFPNEIKMVRDLYGELIWVRRNPEPQWIDIAIENPNAMSKLDVHLSEYSWIGGDYHVIWNDSNLKDLYRKIDEVL